MSRVEGRSIKPYWTLMFSDILLFAKVSRDRVLFITEEPIMLIDIVESRFNIRKKCKISIINYILLKDYYNFCMCVYIATEFRLTIDPNGRTAESPTAHCAPDLTRTPKKNHRRRVIILRTPSPELKAVWQNLVQRQMYVIDKLSYFPKNT